MKVSKHKRGHSHVVPFQSPARKKHERHASLVCVFATECLRLGDDETVRAAGGRLHTGEDKDPRYKGDVMSYSTIRRSVVLFILAVVMAAVSASSAQAAGLGWQQLAGELGHAAWAWLDGAVLEGHQGTGIVKPKNSCGIDPLGIHVCQSIVTDGSSTITPKQRLGSTF